MFTILPSKTEKPNEGYMNKYDQMIADGKFEEFEKLVRSGEASLEDLSEEMFQIFKEWIEA